MPEPHQDPQWQEAADFIAQHWGYDTALVAPREMAPIFPKVLAYELSGAALNNPGQFPAMAIHKGLMDEPPLELLQHLSRDWDPVFANSVFVIFSQDRKLAKISSGHLRAFYARMEELEKINRLYCQPRPRTALMVRSTGNMDALKQTTDNLSIFNIHIFISPLKNNQRDLDHCQRVSESSRPHACTMEILDPSLRFSSHVDLLSDSRAFDWISVFDAGCHARQDLLLALKHFQHPRLRPLISGYLPKKNQGQALESLNRDGYRLLRLPNRSGRHLHFHRNSRASACSLLNGDPISLRSFFVSPKKKPETWVLPGLVNYPD